MTPTFAGRAYVNGAVRDIYWPDPLGACPVCRGSGYRTVEVPMFRDGSYSDVAQIEERCACNPAATDEDYLAAHPWHDDRAGWPGETEYPADPVLPVVDFDRRAA